MKGGARAGGGGRFAPCCGAGMHPPIFFLRHQKENAPCTVEKKKCSDPNLHPMCHGMQVWRCGLRHDAFGRNLSGLIRLRYMPAFGRASMPHLQRWVQTCGCLSEGLLPLAPLTLRWLLTIRRGRCPHRPVSFPLTMTMRAALPASALAYAALGSLAENSQLLIARACATAPLTLHWLLFCVGTVGRDALAPPHKLLSHATAVGRDDLGAPSVKPPIGISPEGPISGLRAALRAVGLWKAPCGMRGRGSSAVKCLLWREKTGPCGSVYFLGG